VYPEKLIAMEVCEQDLVLCAWPCKTSDFSDHDGAELMHRIRKKKKSKRKIRIKRRVAPRRATGRRVRIRRQKGGAVAPMSSQTLRTKPSKGRKIVVVRKRRRSGKSRSAAKPNKRLKGGIYVLSAEGYQLVANPSRRQAQESSRHLIGISRFLRKNDTTALKQFRGKRIGGIELLTDPTRIREFADGDEIKLDGLYRDQRGHGRRK
jgi:hypothetical protein